MKGKYVSAIPKITGALLAASLYLSPAGFLPASAQTSIELEPAQTGSLAGRTFVCYKIFGASYAKNGDSVHYVYDSATKPAVQQVISRRKGISADSLSQEMAADYLRSLAAEKPGELENEQSEYRFLVEELRTALKNAKISGRKITVTGEQANGPVRFEGLEDGYYLIDEERSDAQSGGCASLCLALSAKGTSKVRLKGDYPSLTKKIHEDDGDIGWNDIGDYEIGQAIPYRFNSAVPQISAYQSYYFAMHDRMDPALQFLPETLRITLSGDGKSYELKQEEYALVPAAQNETFRLEIPDLKSIVDREFYGGVKNEPHPYGQAIQVGYDARLTDLACGKEGRPGFENSVRLEFSSDPDSDGASRRGFTPWDTVVAFTYRINAHKQNEKGVSLEGARFELYSDAGCTKEVKVKKGDSGYLVMNSDLLKADPQADRECCDLISDVDGSFSISGLDQGTYYLKETEAPAGYRKLDHLIAIEIGPEYATERNTYVAGQSAGSTILRQLQAQASLVPLDGSQPSKKTSLEVDEADGGVMVSITNRTDLPLPLTGSAMTMICLGAGAVIVTGSASLLKRKPAFRKD